MSSLPLPLLHNLAPTLPCKPWTELFIINCKSMGSMSTQFPCIKRLKLENIYLYDHFVPDWLTSLNFWCINRGWGYFCGLVFLECEPDLEPEPLTSVEGPIYLLILSIHSLVLYSHQLWDAKFINWGIRKLSILHQESGRPGSQT